MYFNGRNYYEPREFRAYQTKAVYSMEDLPIDFLEWHVDNEHPVELNGEVVKLSSTIANFVKNGIVCNDCKIIGVLWALQKTNGNNYHLNLWGVDGSNRLVLMTKSFIVKQSEGGRKETSNMETKCARCNKARH